MRILTTLLALFAFGLTLLAQDQDCLTPVSSDYLERYPDLMQRAPANLSYTVKIAVRVVNEDNGMGGPTRQEVLDELDRLEAYYAPHDICFALMGIYSINDSDFASPAGGFDGDSADDLIDAYPPLDDVVTINILPSYTFFRGTAYAIPNTYTTIYAGRFNTPHLAHEMGHCLGLYHTHETGFGAEKVDGSNCGSAGDKLCDTPADPQLGSNVDGATCNFIGTETDENGETYDPDITNTMSYAPFHCRGSFTPMQEKRMHSILSSPFATDNNILVNTPVLNLCCSVISSGLTHEAALEEILASNYEVNNAAQVRFVAEERITMQPGFTASPSGTGQFNAKINRFCDGDFPDGIPIESMAGASMFWMQAHQSHTAETSEAPTLFPNPVSTDLNLKWTRHDFNIQLFSATGQLIENIQQGFYNESTIDVGHLAPGIYFCHFQSEESLEVIMFTKI
ncbi:MAG: T9SS type A sorting domain-containing protein [Phaeodactylibacter sp.]|nr:T9SS type A sorting domain-containing protein [Phaeodactylibacter sp.]